MSAKNELLEKNKNAENLISEEKIENNKTVEETKQEVKKNEIKNDEKNNIEIKQDEDKNQNKESKNEIDDTNNADNNFNVVKENPKKKSKVKHIIKIILLSLIAILILGFGIFTIYNMFNTNIIYGVYIKDMNVSGMSKSDAKYQLENYLADKLPEEIKVKHGDFETTISLSQIEASFDTKTATDDAFKIGRKGNPLQNNFYVLSTMFGNVTIEPTLSVNTEQLTKNLEEISTQLPDTVIQSS